MLHVEADTLTEDTEPGLSELEDGTRVSPALRSAVSRNKTRARKARRTQMPLGSAETSRRMACDCGVVRIGHGSDGQVKGAGRRKRTVSPALRRALEARDRGCRFPGCGLRFTDAHHVKHWADGGETSLRNLVLLCKTHHRWVHEGGARVCMDVNHQVVFFTPKGRALFGAPPSPLPRPQQRKLSPQQRKLRPQQRKLRPMGERLGPGPGPAASVPGESGAATKEPRLAHIPGAPRWTRDSDIPWALEAQVWEALDSG